MSVDAQPQVSKFWQGHHEATLVVSNLHMIGVTPFLELVECCLDVLGGGGKQHGVVGHEQSSHAAHAFSHLVGHWYPWQVFQGMIYEQAEQERRECVPLSDSSLDGC